MARKPKGPLRRGWTTGACATAATKAALLALMGAPVPKTVTIVLPGGETPRFDIETHEIGEGFAAAGVRKDAGDDPDVTHQALIIATVRRKGNAVSFVAGNGVGTVTMPGLPIAPGEPAINPVPRDMMREEVTRIMAEHGEEPGIEITISVPGGDLLAAKTWNPRLGIKGGISILGTTGIVRPFSCAAWIASIHRGIDVAREAGLTHVAGCTGATSEKTVQALYDLPDYAMLDMGDFVGGLLKYLAKHPIPRITIGGGIGKMTKLAQGARDLHSGRSQVDFDALADVLGQPEVEDMNTALQAYENVGKKMAEWVAIEARATVRDMLPPDVACDTVVIDREGQIIAEAGV